VSKTAASSAQFAQCILLHAIHLQLQLREYKKNFI